MFVVDQKSWSWTLFQNHNDMYLSVVCGGVATYEVDIQLTVTEVSSFKTFGCSFIDELAKSISFSPGSYSNRKSNFRNEFDISCAISKWRESN
ncbi:hypothetical protein [Pseudoalteromonas umbrosa]|uniref:hypothetical protein n=1 Tax=Pseudoalteromonas umbrosa TaxID=3048489 RepID=UPI0024C4355F|nr:hypothetical protein [Pseudoalteromonas sp. B95]MDK1286827.1 hypothetical protein [Pseudoalteromonas sp. B95]